MFGKSKRPKDTMSVKDMTRLDKRPLKYVTMRDPETYKEVRLGENGAVNIMEQVKKCRLSHTLRINSDATKQGLLFLPILQNDFCE